MEHLDKTVMAYLAGIVDGDGGIYFAPKNVGGVGTIKLTVNSTTLELMDWLVKVAGGKYSARDEWTKHGDRRRLGSKLCYSWSITSERSAIVVRAMMPYLIVKHDRGSEALQLWQDSYQLMTRPKRRDLHTATSRAEMSALGWPI